jgi:hypothetical protein
MKQFSLSSVQDKFKIIDAGQKIYKKLNNYESNYYWWISWVLTLFCQLKINKELKCPIYTDLKIQQQYLKIIYQIQSIIW